MHGELNGFGRRFDRYVNPEDLKDNTTTLDLGWFERGMLYGYVYYI